MITMDWIILIIAGLCEVGFVFFITTLIASIVGLKIIS